MIGPSPSSAIGPIGRLSTSEPSTISWRPRTIGGTSTGMAMLVPTASHSGAVAAARSALAVAQVGGGAR